MANKILIPTPLRPFTGKQDAVEVDGATIGELLTNLTSKYEGLKPHLYNEQGKLRSFVNVYLNDEDIRYLEKEKTTVKPGDTISIIPRAGGARSRAGSRSDAPQALSNDEVKRYSRHLIMPEVGVEGQEKLKKGSVLCIGAGGLGSPAALYLAAAGVGTIGIVDFDVVDFSNLQRQIIHGTSDVGRSKLASAKDRLLALNPHVNIETYETALSSQERARAVQAVRRDPRRHRQLSDALPRERRVRDARQAERLRQHLPLRRAGVGLRHQGRSVLSLPVSGAAAARTGAELRRGRRARRAAGRHRHDSGDRSDQADHGHRRAADRPVPDLRRAADEVPRAEAEEGS